MFAMVSIFAILSVSIAVGGAPARAATQKAGAGDVYTILDVAVDVTAKTAAAARGLARAQGHMAAFRRLMARLVPRARIATLPKLDAEGVAALVRDFEVDAEKTSRVRYLGTLSFRFNRNAVRRLLREASVPFAETRNKPLLVLPVYRTAGTYLLWDNPNPWRTAWAKLPPSDGLVPMIIPRGDLADINDISPDQAARGETGRMRTIMRRYGAAGMVVALAVRTRDRASKAALLQVTVTRSGATDQDRTLVRSFVAKQGQRVAGLIAYAAQAMSRQIEEDWKADNLLRFDQRSMLVALVPLRGLEDWVFMERKLQGIAFLQTSELIALSRREAMVRLRYFGDREQLVSALAQRDVSLARGAVSWVLRPTRDSEEESGDKARLSE